MTTNEMHSARPAGCLSRRAFPATTAAGATTLALAREPGLQPERIDSDIVRAGRAGTLAAIAPAVLFLCSDRARWIEGVNLAAAGGLEGSIGAETYSF